mgnify:CR=1 FL=1
MLRAQPLSRCAEQVNEDARTVTVAAGITQRRVLDYLAGECL